ncbi:hypothetical protein SEVIR_7G061900v4 [Setaria viridis]|uniref:Bifunctional inhibitor/plant lipid transfer protein/seed storage helical domain-containing protein n=1 Tax=Setaria viridis TaxID=4556 RepID=A0A4U6TQS0_SETVI|nr:hypothetical protein SEVIR_7G061900v2 [Setaria viridis]
MASMRLFLLLATLTVAVAASGLVTTQAYPMPEEPKKEEPSHHPTNPSCDDCNALKVRLVPARNKCCSEVSKHLKCLCPTMNTLIDAGIPLKEVCYDDMECKPTYKGPSNPLPGPLSKAVDTEKPCSVPANLCDDLKHIMSEQKQNGCTLNKAGDHSSQGSCFTKILSEIKLIEKLNHQ